MYVALSVGILWWENKDITFFVKIVYFAWFGIKVGDQDRLLAPHTVCSVCVGVLRNCTNGKKKALRLRIPMVWRQPINHTDDCYLVCVNWKALILKIRKELPIPICLLPKDQCHMAMIHQCLIVLSNLIRWRLNEVPLPTNRQRILSMVPTHMAHLNLSLELNWTEWFSKKLKSP